MTLADCGFYHILLRADALFSLCSWEAEWKWNTHSHPFARGLIRSRRLSQILELILQAKPDSVALSGSPCWMCYEGSHWATNTYPSSLYLSLHLPEQFNEKRGKDYKKENHAEIHCPWFKDKSCAESNIFLNVKCRPASFVTRCQFQWIENR